ncbi:hypothetical protein [Enterococcus faecium]|uniref:hypothetical protein n=1 Tax=Enterococcus faecium TaxID=1352 RepID=UPI0018841C07|nr:hypothetical protein [Enterococcus faecium]MBE9882411.1 hypothetical protein [Enterococcus faecium]
MNENQRAIDTEELLQVLDESEGIYLSTLVDILQCNRINLIKRLKVLEKNSFIKSIKADKKIYYRKKYDLKNVNALAKQAEFLNSNFLLSDNIYYSKVSVQTSAFQNKSLVLNLIFHTKKCHNTYDSNKYAPIFEHRDLQFTNASDKKQYWQHLYSEAIKIVLNLTFIDYKSFNQYSTENYNYSDILLIEDDSLLRKIQEQLQKDFYMNNKKNKFRTDILIFNSKNDTLYYFEKKYIHGQIKYINTPMLDIFMFIQHFFLNKSRRVAIEYTISTEEFEEWIALYKKSKINKQLYNTVSIRKSNKINNSN